MKKSELIEALVQQLNLSQKVVKTIVDTIIETRAEGLIQGHSVQIRGFGTFTIRKKPECCMCHPKTKNIYKIAERKSIYFKPGKELRNQLRAD